MKAAVAVFVKTPALSAVKTRLAAGIGQEKAEAFFYAAQVATEALLKQLQTLAKAHAIEVTPYWAIAEQDGLDHDLWRGFKRIYTGAGGLGERLASVYSRLLEPYEAVVLLGMDSPQNTAKNMLNALLLLKQEERLVIGPSYDGGFYLFAGNCMLNQQHWCENVVYGNEQTLQALSRNLSSFSLERLPALLDVDDMSDLSGLLQDLSVLPKDSVLPEQQELMVWVRKQLQQLNAS